MRRYDEEVKWVLKTNLFTFVIEHVLPGEGLNLLEELKANPSPSKQVPGTPQLDERRNQQELSQRKRDISPSEKSVLAES